MQQEQMDKLREANQSLGDKVDRLVEVFLSVQVAVLPYPASAHGYNVQDVALAVRVGRTRWSERRPPEGRGLSPATGGGQFPWRGYFPLTVGSD